MTTCPSRLALARALSGDDDELLARLEAHATSCSRCQALLTSMRGNLAAFEMPRELARLRTRLANERPRRWWWSLVPALGVAAIAFMMIVRTDDPDVTFKGSTALRVIVQRDNVQFDLDDGAVLRPRDVLRLVLNNADTGYFAALLVADDGSVTQLYPQPGADDATAMAVTKAGTNALEDGFALDDSRAPESLIWAFAERPFAVAKLRAWASSKEPSKGTAQEWLGVDARVGIIHYSKQP